MKITRLAVGILLAGLLTAAAPPSPPQRWERLARPPSPPSIVDVAASDQIVAALLEGSGTGTGALLVSPDAGKTWARRTSENLGLKPQEGIRSLSALGAALFIGTTQTIPGGGIKTWVLRSQDEGRSWERSETPFAKYPAHSFIQLGDAVFAASRDGIARSTDGGKTWALTDTRQMVSERVVAPANGRLYACDNELWRLDENGKTWERLRQLPWLCHSLAEDGGNFYAGTENGLWRSRDEGRTWSQVSQVPDAVITNLRFVGTTLVGLRRQGTSLEAFRSARAGKWPRMLPGTPLSLLAVGGGVLWALTDLGEVFRSVDGGLGWSPAGLPDEPGLPFLVTGASEASIQVGLVLRGVPEPGRASDWRLAQGLVSPDQGKSWSIERDHPFCIRVTPTACRSTDGGRHWQATSFVDPSFSVTLHEAVAGRLAFRAADVEQQGERSCHFSISRSAGATWDTVSAELPSRERQEDPTAGNEDGQSATDEGDAPQEAPGPAPLKVEDALIASNGRILVATNRGLALAEADGLRWCWSEEGFGAPAEQPATVISLAGDGRRVYALTAALLWRSDDSGATWEALPAIAAPTGCPLLRVSAAHGELLLEAGALPNAIHVFRSLDRGQTWAELKLPAPANPLTTLLAPGKSGWYYAGADALWRLPFQDSGGKP